MAELRITIPNDKVQLVLDAFADRYGIEPTPQAVKQEIIGEIKTVVKQYKLKRLAVGQDHSVSQEDMEVDAN